MDKRTVIMGGDMALSLITGLSLGMRSIGKSRRIASPRTPEQIKAAAERAERQRWNDRVEENKQARLAAKGKA